LSLNEKEIVDFLQKRGLSFLPSPRFNASSNTLILDVPIDMICEKVERHKTSRRQLAGLRATLQRQFDVSVLFAYRASSQLLNIEVGLQSLLQRKFEDKVSDLVLSFPSATQVDATIFLSTDGDDGSIRKFVTEYLQTGGFAKLAVEIVGVSRPLPSLAAILRSVKVHAPVDLDQLMSELARRKYRCPDKRWLSGRLDVVRKKGLVIRLSTGAYALSADGLAVVPFSADRSSSDIERILALARRKKW
jgi:hypothetical protein